MGFSFFVLSTYQLITFDFLTSHQKNHMVLVGVYLSDVEFSQDSIQNSFAVTTAVHVNGCMCTRTLD